MFKINPNFKFKKDQKGIESFLSETLERVAYENGCCFCNGKNLTVYVNEFTDTYVNGCSYCHDCNAKNHVHVDIVIDGEIRKIENEMKKMFKR